MDPVSVFILGYGAGAGTASFKLLGQAAFEIVKPALTQTGEPLRKRVEDWQKGSFEALKRRSTTNTAELFERVDAILEARGVPPEARQQPPEELLANVLVQQHLALGGDTIRTLFASLLAGSMDSRSSGRLHPTIPDALRQLDEAGARTLALLWEHHELGYEVQVTSRMSRGDGRTIELNRFALIGAAVAGREDRDTLSASVPHLQRLGLVEVASWVTSNPESTPLFASKANRTIVELSEFGCEFCAACLGARLSPPPLPPGSTQAVISHARRPGT